MQKFFRVVLYSTLLGAIYILGSSPQVKAEYLHHDTTPTELRGNWYQTNGKLKNGQFTGSNNYFQGDPGGVYIYNNYGLEQYSRNGIEIGNNKQTLNVMPQKIHLPNIIKNNYYNFTPSYLLNNPSAASAFSSGFWFTAINKTSGMETLININNEHINTYAKSILNNAQINTYVDAISTVRHYYWQQLSRTIKVNNIGGSQKQGFYKFKGNGMTIKIPLKGNVKNLNEADNFAKHMMIHKSVQNIGFIPLSSSDNNQSSYKLKSISYSTQQAGGSGTLNIFRVNSNGQIKKLE